MVGRNPEETPLSWTQVHAFRLRRHHLAKRAAPTALPRVAEGMAGAHAQVMAAAQMSLRARTRGLRPEDVDKALWTDRTLVKGWWLRGALHLISSGDVAVFAGGGAGRAARWTAWLSRAGIPAASVDRAIESVRLALDRPLTQAELAERVAKSLGTRTRTTRADRGWGGVGDAVCLDVGGKLVTIGGILQLAALRGVACFGPARGREATFVEPAAWIQGLQEIPGGEAEEELLRRYLRAFAPATVADFATWTYLRAADARGIWGRLGRELAPVSVGGRSGSVLQSDLRAIRRAKVGRPLVRLLHYFDSYLLGHKDKSHLVDAAHYKRVYRRAGWLSPVVLVDGQVAGVWDYERKGRRLAVRIEAFHPLPRDVRDCVGEEANDVGRFLQADEVDLTFTGATRRAQA